MFGPGSCGTYCKTVAANYAQSDTSKKKCSSLFLWFLGESLKLTLDNHFFLPPPPPFRLVSAVNDFTVIRKKFKCPYCSFSAMHQCILKRHMRSHTGERPYPCEICGKKFTRREHMKRHTLVSAATVFFFLFVI